MRNKIVCFCLTWLVFQGIVILDLPLLGEEESREIPVRIFYKGKIVKNLAKEDFELNINGKQREITGFTAKGRKISGESRNKVKKPELRTFVLVYQVTDFNESLQESLDYIFENFLRDNDRLVILANEKKLHFPRLDNRDKIKNEIKDVLKKKSNEKKEKLLRVEKFFEAKTFTIRADTYEEILRRYLKVWQNYKDRYLSPDFAWFYYLATLLEQEGSEKWVFHFYQFDVFPMLGMTTSFWNSANQNASSSSSAGALYAAFGRTLQHLINQVDKELNVNRDLLPEEISKLFCKFNAALYSFLVMSDKLKPTNDFSYYRVKRSIETGLKDLAEATGGTFFHSKNIVKSLDSIKEKEDYYYMLSCKTEKPGSEAVEIEIKTKNKKYKVFYDDNVRSKQLLGYLNKFKGRSKPGDIKIEDFSFKQKKLFFTIRNFMMQEKKEGVLGALKVRIKVVNKDNVPVFDKAKILNAVQEVLNVSIPFDQLKEGEYTVFIEVTDLLTNKSASFSDSIVT